MVQVKDLVRSDVLPPQKGWDRWDGGWVPNANAMQICIYKKEELHPTTGYMLSQVNENVGVSWPHRDVMEYNRAGHGTGQAGGTRRNLSMNVGKPCLGLPASKEANSSFSNAIEV